MGILWGLGSEHGAPHFPLQVRYMKFICEKVAFFLVLLRRKWVLKINGEYFD
jgi:hypothetical protein